MREPITRRSTIGTLIAGVSAVATRDTAAADNVPAAAARQFPGQCRLLPQAVEGPYYFDPKLARADIAEGRPGLPMRLKLRVIESGRCVPLPNLRVDVWHADAGGIYSGYTRQGDKGDVATTGQTYLRGTQMTDADGFAIFLTIFPGWYPGRTPHIHVKVFLDEKSLLTGQVYFPEELSKRIYATEAPYKSRPVADTINSSDWIFQDGEREGGGTVLATSDEAGLLVAALLIGVDRSGKAAANSRGYLRRLLGL